MAEYIEREAVRDMLHAEIEAWGSSAEEIDALLKVNDKLFEIPAADVAPVVRCKDCKWFAEVVGKDSGKPCGYGQCNRPLCMRSLLGTDDFCSYGERKDGD